MRNHFLTYFVWFGLLNIRRLIGPTKSKLMTSDRQLSNILISGVETMLAACGGSSGSGVVVGQLSLMQ